MRSGWGVVSLQLHRRTVVDLMSVLIYTRLLDIWNRI